MGGYEGGEIASRLAIDAAKRYIENNFEDIEDDKESILNLIRDSMEYANKVVFETAGQSEELKNMGTTLEVCLIYNNRAYIGHIGDSRIYRIRDKFFMKLTTDHSYVETLVKDRNNYKRRSKTPSKKEYANESIRMLRICRTRYYCQKLQRRRHTNYDIRWLDKHGRRRNNT